MVKWYLTFSQWPSPFSVRSMRAFNPFIPLNDRDSSIPAAFFEILLTNTTHAPLQYTVCAALKNPFPPSRALNRFRKHDGVSLIKLSSSGVDPGAVEYGDLSVATDAAVVSYQENWYRGSWFDNLSVYWRDFTTPGQFMNRSYGDQPGTVAIAYSKEEMAGLAVHLDVRPGTTGVARFVIAWSFPNVTNYWNPEKKTEGECRPGGPAQWRNYYASVFPDSTESASYSLANWERLERDTMLFRDTLFSTTLPAEVLDAVSANLSILKSPTVLRLEDGTLYGFEGCHPASGCCEGSCTHVWNYAYALPFLFPALERSMRDVDFRYNLGADGGMSFRLQLPLGRERPPSRACADGQFGGVIKCYREWKISGDTDWLRRHWGTIKRNLEFAWAEANQDRWDRDRDGVLEGRQHHTLDMELFGPNSWLTGLHLGALAAAAEMAEHLGEPATAADYRALFDRGRAWVDEHLFNGAYYYQLIDLSDRSVLASYEDADSLALYGTESTQAAYWSEEHDQIKYQVADGCGIDQVLAQWHANLVGLGRVFDAQQTRTALRSIYRNNFKQDLRKHANPCRIYALNDEQGAVICSFPKGAPAIPVPYAEEAMNGFEYQVACHLIQEGLVEEGLDIVRAVRDRYDGRRRNPWNEFECGSNYARSMASYSLLLALSGFSFDLRSGHLGFRPVVPAARFRCFWSIDGAWGGLPP